MIPSAHSNKLGVMEQTKKEPLKKNKLNRVVYFVLFIIVIWWFYWFQFRPAQIRKKCALQADKAVKDIPVDSFCKSTTETYFKCLNTIYDTAYELCLKRKGLIK